MPQAEVIGVSVAVVDRSHNGSAQEAPLLMRMRRELKPI
jgi:hypothetical protein